MNNLLKWKAKYGSVYQIQLESYTIIYRSLTAWEIQALSELKESKADQDLEMSSCLLAVLTPTPLPAFKRPGTISSLSAAIWDKSVPALDELPDKAASARQWAEDSINNNFSITLATIMAKVLPSVDLISLMNMTLPQLLKIGALVEKITNIQFITGSPADTTGTPTPDFAQEETDEASTALSAALHQLKTKK